MMVCPLSGAGMLRLAHTDGPRFTMSENLGPHLSSVGLFPTSICVVHDVIAGSATVLIKAPSCRKRGKGWCGWLAGAPAPDAGPVAVHGAAGNGLLCGVRHAERHLVRVTPFACECEGCWAQGWRLWRRL